MPLKLDFAGRDFMVCQRKDCVWIIQKTWIGAWLCHILLCNSKQNFKILWAWAFVPMKCVVLWRHHQHLTQFLEYHHHHSCMDTMNNIAETHKSRLLALQSRVITTSQTYVWTGTNTTGLRDSYHHQSHRVTERPHPPPQGCVNTTEMSQVIWEVGEAGLWEHHHHYYGCLDAVATTAELCEYCYHHRWNVWRPQPTLQSCGTGTSITVTARDTTMSQMSQNLWIPSPATLQSEVINMTKVAEWCQ